MRIQGLLLLFFTNLAFGQYQTVANAPVSVTPTHADDIVIVLNGYCTDPPQLNEACKTEITRSEFEQLSAALQPALTDTQRLTIAYAYARNLRMAVVAQQRGIDKTEKFAQQMRYARLQLLAQDLNQSLQTQADQISDAELAAYYRAHQADFEEAVFERIIVPHVGRTPEARVDAMAQLATQVRARLQSGETSDQLQRDVFTQSATPYKDVNTRMEKIRSTSLPPNQAQVMAMQVGQVSDVISDPDGAHFIFKMIEKRLPEIAEVRDEMIKSISTQRFQDSTKEFQGNTVFSDSYFNPASAQVGQSGQHGRAGKRMSANDQ